jgi:hypothetical protein
VKTKAAGAGGKQLRPGAGAAGGGGKQLGAGAGAGVGGVGGGAGVVGVVGRSSVAAGEERTIGGGHHSPRQDLEEHEEAALTKDIFD